MLLAIVAAYVGKEDTAWFWGFVNQGGKFKEINDGVTWLISASNTPPLKKRAVLCKQSSNDVQLLP